MLTIWLNRDDFFFLFLVGKLNSQVIFFFTPSTSIFDDRFTDEGALNGSLLDRSFLRVKGI